MIVRVEESYFPESVIENPQGRLQSLFPGDLLLTTVADRESTRWSIGYVPTGNVYESNRKFPILSTQGIIGDFVDHSSDGTPPSTIVSILGVAISESGDALNIIDFAMKNAVDTDEYRIPTVVISGTSAEAGKTTAAVAAIRVLRKENVNLFALKACGTASVIEKMIYEDCGAVHSFDSIDFGYATTYPSGRHEFSIIYSDWLKKLSGIGSQAAVIECGGDTLGANVPNFFEAITKTGSPIFHIVSASDAMGALGAVRNFSAHDVRVDFICGRCAENALLARRTEALCEVLAGNLLRGQGLERLQESMLAWYATTA